MQQANVSRTKVNISTWHSFQGVRIEFADGEGVQYKNGADRICLSCTLWRFCYGIMQFLAVVVAGLQIFLVCLTAYLVGT